MSNFGKAYLAFTALNGAGGGDVRAAFYDQGQWALEPTALDANPADAAGTGRGRPEVATAGDGTGIVVWGENGAIFKPPGGGDHAQHGLRAGRRAVTRRLAGGVGR